MAKISILLLVGRRKKCCLLLLIMYTHICMAVAVAVASRLSKPIFRLLIPPWHNTVLLQAGTVEWNTFFLDQKPLFSRKYEYQARSLAPLWSLIFPPSFLPYRIRSHFGWSLQICINGLLPRSFSLKSTK